MANWNGLVMTDKGIALQSKVQAGEVLNITKLKLGSGTLPAETDIRKLTDLIKPEQNLGIGGREPNGDYCKISATISNVGLEAGYYVRELGVFAQDPDDGEILYAYTTDGAPDYLPAEGGSTVISQEFSVNIAVSDTDKINVEIDPGALATMGYVQLQINEHNEDAAAHEQAFSQHNTDETAHYNMTGATSSKAGKRGLVPAPKAGDQNKVLFGNGQFQEVIVKTDIMVGATSSNTGIAGLVPVPAAGKQTSFLRGDGTWQTVPQPVIATQAEAEAGTDNTKHMTPLRVKQAINKLVPPAGDYIVDYYVSGRNWWRKWKSGWLEQGGYMTATGRLTEVTLLKPMANTNYTAHVNDVGQAYRSFAASAKSTTVLNVWCQESGMVGAWSVRGMGA